MHLSRIFLCLVLVNFLILFVHDSTSPGSKTIPSLYKHIILSVGLIMLFLSTLLDSDYTFAIVIFTSR